MTAARRISAGLLALALAALGAGAAQACEPAPNPPGTSVRQGACGIAYYDEAYFTRAIGDARDLGNGAVAQYYFEGNACWGTVSMAVVDCAAGAAAVFGPGPNEGPEMPAPASHVWKQLEDQVLRGAAAGRMMPVADIAAQARGAGFVNAAQVAVPASVRLSNDGAAPKHSYDLGCGCRVFYPGSAGAGS